MVQINLVLKYLRDENTMFCIFDLMPVCSGGDYYLKYFSVVIFLSSLCYGQVVFGAKTKDPAQRPGTQGKEENKS